MFEEVESYAPCLLKILTTAFQTKNENKTAVPTYLSYCINSLFFLKEVYEPGSKNCICDHLCWSLQKR